MTGFITPTEALEVIWKIVHTRTKDTKHRTAEDHFMADFDAIRRTIRATGILNSDPDAAYEARMEGYR